MGQSDIRKLLIVGAMSRIRWIVRKGVLPDNWLGRCWAANHAWLRPSRWPTRWRASIWAMMTREQNYRMA